MFFILFAGIRTRSARCVRSDDKTPASDKACGREPSTKEKCQIKDCPSAYVGINQLIHQSINRLVKEGRKEGREKGKKLRRKEEGE